MSDLRASLLKVPIRAEPDIVTARQKTRRVCEELGFDSQNQVRVATAVSELARNVFQYVGKGDVEFLFSESPPQTLFIQVTDEGRGIADLESVLSGTYRSKSGMGVGLTGTRKLMDHFSVQTAAATGTVVTIGKLFDRQMKFIGRPGLQKVIERLSVAEAANPYEELQNQNRELHDALDEVREAREKLTQVNSELADTNRNVVALYAELDERAISLEHATEAKSRFLSNMSHEIRTPLGVIQGFSMLAMDPQISQKELYEFLTTICRNAENLTKLIGEILDLSKIEAGKIEIENSRFSLPQLVTEIATALSLQAKKKQLVLRFEIDGAIPEYVQSDPTLVRQVLINVINNAIKFTLQGEVVMTARLDVGFPATLEPSIEFLIKDSGIGLSKDQQSRIFQAFTQADSSTTRRFGGTGLGLSLSKKLAHALGGDLVLLESVSDVGSTFKFTFNAGPARGENLVTCWDVGPSPKVTNPKFSGELNGLKVLLVEDSEDNQKLVSHYLRQAGASVDFASNGRCGVDMAMKNSYDVILMDVQMPILDGHGATAELRSSGLKIPIIALTAHALKEDREFALAQGFSDYLTKPLNSAKLIQMLKAIGSGADPAPFSRSLT